jgi:hypothetical protein
MANAPVIAELWKNFIRPPDGLIRDGYRRATESIGMRGPDLLVPCSCS